MIRFNNSNLAQYALNSATIFFSNRQLSLPRHHHQHSVLARRRLVRGSIGRRRRRNRWTRIAGGRRCYWQPHRSRRRPAIAAESRNLCIRDECKRNTVITTDRCCQQRNVRRRRNCQGIILPSSVAQIAGSAGYCHRNNFMWTHAHTYTPVLLLL